jgi:hypothetical protein
LGKPEGKMPVEEGGNRQEDNIKMDLKEIGRGGTDWIRLVLDRDQWRALVHMVMNLSVS